MNERFNRLGKAKYYSKLDLKTGLRQIRIAPRDIEKAVFRIICGQHEFLVMPLGLRVAPAIFQVLMN